MASGPGPPAVLKVHRKRRRGGCRLRRCGARFLGRGRECRSADRGILRDEVVDGFQPEHLGVEEFTKGARGDGHDLVERGAQAGFKLDGGDRLGEAAGDDVLEEFEGGGDVKGEAVRGDSARDVNTDGGDFALGQVGLFDAAAKGAGSQVIAAKDAARTWGTRISRSSLSKLHRVHLRHGNVVASHGAELRRGGTVAKVQRPVMPADALGFDAVVGADAHEDFFEAADVGDDSELGREGAQVEDGIGDKLSGSVKGDVAAAIDLVNLDADGGEKFARGNNV